MGLVGGRFQEGDGRQTVESLVLCILSPMVTSQCPSHLAFCYFLILTAFIVPNFHDTHSPVIYLAIPYGLLGFLPLQWSLSFFFLDILFLGNTMQSYDLSSAC